MKQKISASQPDHPDGPQSPATSETDQDTQPDQDTVQSVPSSQTTSQYKAKGKGKGKGKSRQTPQDTTDELLENIRQQQSNVRLQDQICAVLEPVRVSTQSLFGSFVGSMVESSVHPDLQPRFYWEAFTLLMKFVEESRQLTAAPTAQPQPQCPLSPQQQASSPSPTPTAWILPTLRPNISSSSGISSLLFSNPRPSEHLRAGSAWTVCGTFRDPLRPTQPKSGQPAHQPLV